jgi:hypothetical protein
MNLCISTLISMPQSKRSLTQYQWYLYVITSQIMQLFTDNSSDCVHDIGRIVLTTAN